MPLFILVMFLLLVLYLILIDYYQQGWKLMPVYEPSDLPPSVRLSVIVPVRNEEQHIQTLIDGLLQQSYPSAWFEVIIIDDHSTDNSWQLLQQYQAKSENIKVFQLQGFLANNERPASFKKKAIETGISLSSGKLIVTTDADCTLPVSWLHTIAAFYQERQAAFIAAPVTIDAGHSFLSKFQSLDFLILQGITGASVFRNFHSMCNGANLAYEKEAFEAVGGFSGIDQIATGDDMLLMHKIRLRYPARVYYLKSKKALVHTRPAGSWNAFFHQRIRWASKADSYADKNIFKALLLVYLLNVCFLALGIAAFFSYTWLIFFLLFLFVKIITEYPFVAAVASFFDQRRLMKFFVVMQPIHIIYTIIAGWLGKFGSYEWKGRRIKK